MEAVLPIEFQIPSLKLAVELFPDTSPLEECLLYLEQLDDKCRDATLANEAHKKQVKCQYDSLFILRFSPKVTLSWSMTKIRIPWGQASSNPCGSDLSL
jgi:hypothetical protein